MKVNRFKLFFASGRFLKIYKKYVIGIVVVAIITTGIFFSSKTDFNSSKFTVNQTDKQESEVLGTSEQENDIEEIPTAITTQEMLSNEAEEDTVLPISTPTPTQNNGGSVYIPTFNNSSNPNTPTPIHTNTVIVVEVTPTPLPPTPTPTQPPPPTVFISPEVENALNELNQTLTYIGNQTVPLSVIQGRKQQAYQNWVLRLISTGLMLVQ